MSADVQRRVVYQRMFGEPADVLADVESPPIDVHIYSPGHGQREFYTLITSGMSDRPMAVPDDLQKARRAELALYVDQPGPSTVELLRTLAHAPFDHGLWLGHGHTLPNGDPPAALFPGSELSVVLVVQTVVSPERHTDEQVEIEGDPLNILCLLPITEAECQLKLSLGLDALLDKFNEEQLSFVLDPGRPSLC